MKHNYDHMDPDSKMDELFGRLEPPFEKSREEVWESLNRKIEGKAGERKVIKLSSYRLIAGLAATILVMLGIFSVMRFYTNTVECPAGQHLAYVLPDGSSVQLNAESTLKYHPLWWSFSRSLKFEGEAFFEVTKGSKFEVFSDMGTTAVLGTSFNIFSREDEYKVTCFTGKVKVSSPVTSEQVIITPDYKAEISKNGSITVSKEQKPSSDISWINNMFNFNAQPLSIVFKEIERQYNIQIQSNIALDYYYTGYFSKDKPVEEVLALVCKPFGLTFVRLSDNSYKIIQNQ